MGKSAPTPPPAPDPTVVAAAQTSSDEATALYQSHLNNGNSYGPTGSVTNSYNPNNNQWTQTTTLSPTEQGIFNSGTQAQQGALNVANQQIPRVAQALNTTLTPPSFVSGTNTQPLDFSYASGGPIQTSFNPGQAVQGQIASGGPIQTSYAGGGPIQSQIGTQDVSGAVNQAELASYDQATQLLNPQYQQAAEAQNASLVAQGLNPNHEAYQSSQNIFNQGMANAYNDAAYGAVQAGDAEQNTLFGQQATQGQFANAAQAQAYAQNAALAQFANAAQAQQFGQTQAQGQFANAAAAQEYAQNAGLAQFADAAQAQQNSQNAAAAAFNNTAEQQEYQQQYQNNQAYNQNQQQAFQDTAYSQQQPINELDALMSSGQVQMPASAQLSGTSVAPTNVLDAYALQQAQLNQNYQDQTAQQASTLGGLFNLGSAAIGLM